jgi:hypothetical protein
MTLDDVRSLLTTMGDWERRSPDPGGPLVASFLRHAFQYARMRADWRLASVEERARLDAPRRAAHDAFIDSCDALSRAMGHPRNEWRRRLGDVREDVGDFACLVHAALGLAAR